MMFIRVSLLVALARVAGAQLPGIEPPKTATQQPQADDPLGRSTPRGTITGFTEAVHRNDLTTAARYLQLDDSQRVNADTLARKLSQLMDRYYGEPIQSIDGSRTGALDDGLAEDRERIGPLSVDSKKIDVELVRVSDSLAGPVWLLSSETLREVPALHRLIKPTWFERAMPPAFVRPSLFGVSLAQWIVLAATIAVPIIVLRLMFGVIVRIARRTVGAARRGALDSIYASLRWPAIVVLTLAIHLSYMPFMRLPLTFRISYGRLGFVALIVALAWLLRCALTVASDRARYLMAGGAHSGARSLIMLGERLVKALVVVVAGLAIATGRSLWGTRAASPTVWESLKTSRCARYDFERRSRRCCRYPRAPSQAAASRISRRGQRFSCRRGCIFIAPSPLHSSGPRWAKSKRYSPSMPSSNRESRAFDSLSSERTPSSSSSSRSC